MVVLGKQPRRARNRSCHGELAVNPVSSDPVIRRRQLICAAVLVLQGIYQLALLPTLPALIGSHPVALEALRGSTAAMVAGGAFARVGRASLVLALLAPLPTLMMSDPFLWWAGRLWGPEILQYVGGRSQRAQRRTLRAQKWIERWCAPAIVLAYIIPIIPAAAIYAAAGWTGMRLRWFLLWDLIGTLLWVGLMVGLGYAIGQPAVNIAHKIAHYGLYATIALIVVVMALAVWQTPRAAPGEDAGPRV
jgi:membrane-associated protein